MKRLMLTLGVAGLLVPVSATMPVGASIAQARTTHQYRSNARRCRYSSGTTGLVAGGVAGAVVGSKVIGHGLVGAGAGAAGGALAGRAVDRTITAKKRCR